MKWAERSGNENVLEGEDEGGVFPACRKIRIPQWAFFFL